MEFDGEYVQCVQPTMTPIEWLEGENSEGLVPPCVKIVALLLNLTRSPGKIPFSFAFLSRLLRRLFSMSRVPTWD